MGDKQETKNNKAASFLKPNPPARKRKNGNEPSLFKNHEQKKSKKNIPPEERMMIREIKNLQRPGLIERLTVDGVPAPEADIEMLLDKMIEEYYKKGLIKRVMKGYLNDKQAEERARFRGESPSS